MLFPLNKTVDVRISRIGVSGTWIMGEVVDARTPGVSQFFLMRRTYDVTYFATEAQLAAACTANGTALQLVEASMWEP